MLGWFRALMPREERFFELFTRHAQVTVAGAIALRALLNGSKDVAEGCSEIAQREAEADELTREVLTALRRTFITPFDRGDIKDLITRWTMPSTFGFGSRGVCRSEDRLLKSWPDLQICSWNAKVSAARLAPTSGEVVNEFQLDSSRTDSPVRILYAQPGRPVSASRHFAIWTPLIVCKPCCDTMFD